MARRLRAALLAVAALAPGGFAAPVAAHCGPQGGWSCPLNEPLEAATEMAADATGRELVTVLVKDFQFHPPVVRVASAAAVRFVWADVGWSSLHTVTSSGPCQDPSVDVASDPLACAPASTGRCFNSVLEQGGTLDSLGDTYAVSLRFSPPAGPLEATSGALAGLPVAGEPPLTPPYRACPPSTARFEEGAAVVAYHCVLHGGSGTNPRTMRGAIVVVP